MDFSVLASDYDGTLATHGELHNATLEALQRVAASGRRLILVTGRTIDGLRVICPEVDIFDLIVAENGAVLFDRADGRSRLLAEPIPDNFAIACHARGVPEVHLGQVIAASWGGFAAGVRQTIAELGLDLTLSHNKGSLMILPHGIDKASGLSAALLHIGASAAATVALGDAENDIPMLEFAGCAVAVANALDEVKEIADIVTTATHGEGAVEVLNALVADDLRALLNRPNRLRSSAREA